MRKLAMSGGEAVWDLLNELSETVKQVEASNDPAFGTTGTKLRDALQSAERASKWLLEKIASAPNEALAGSTPYLRLMSSATGGVMLAREALAARGDEALQSEAPRYVTLARFFAENVAVQAGALERAVIDGADAITGADAVLVG
jgi:hypothetical protein